MADRNADLKQSMRDMVDAFLDAIEKEIARRGLSGDWSFSAVVSFGTKPEFGSSLGSIDAVVPVVQEAIKLIRDEHMPVPGEVTPLHAFMADQSEAIADGVRDFFEQAYDETPSIILIFTADGATFYIGNLEDDSAEKLLRSLLLAIENNKFITTIENESGKTLH